MCIRDSYYGFDGNEVEVFRNEPKANQLTKHSSSKDTADSYNYQSCFEKENHGANAKTVNVDLEPYIYRPHPIYRLPSREDAAITPPPAEVNGRG